jgi:hypothetical protein
MTFRNNKTNAFEAPQSKPRISNARLENRLIDESWSLISERMGALMPVFFAKLDDDLFKMSEKAETNALGEMFFEVMRYIRKERENIESQYLEAVLRRFDEYWIGPNAKSPAQSVNAVSESAGEFLLMDDSALEESLAVHGMIEKGNGLYQTELFPLNQRFCAVSSIERDYPSLPISPETLCKEFEAVLQALSLDLKAKLLVYKIFDRQIICNFGQIYHELNAHLAASGILPSISRHLKRSTVAADAAAQASVGGGDDVAEAAAYLEAFRSMQSLMDGWRNQLGTSPLSAAAMAADAIIVDSREVLGALSSLQLPSDDSEDGNQPVSADSLKQYVALQLGKAKDDNKARSMGRSEEDIIDMVGLIFDFILDDKNLSAPIRGLIARLQIPVIKVAIIDKAFFAKKNHPTRALLNALAQVGIGLGVAETDADNPVIRKVEEIVTRVLQEFDQQVGLFEELLQDLNTFMEKDSQRSKIAEDRTRQVTQSKERVWLAKKAVASEITLRLQGRDTSAAFRSFLYNDWKDVLVLAYLRQDKMDGEWERSLEIMDKLMWSVTPPTNPRERQDIIRTIPGLLKSIKEGLESISLDPHQIAALLKDLEVCHMSALRSTASARAGGELEPGREEARMSPTSEVNIKDAELAEAILEIKTHLPDISNVDIEEVVMGSAGAHARQDLPIQKADYAQGVFLEVVNRLKVGDWLEFMDEEDRAFRAKLSWKSPATSLCVFVNRRGVKVLELKVNDLVGRLREGKARVIEDASTPLMDRAVSFLTQSLKNPFMKAAESSA